MKWIYQFLVIMVSVSLVTACQSKNTLEFTNENLPELATETLVNQTAPTTNTPLLAATITNTPETLIPLQTPTEKMVFLSFTNEVYCRMGPGAEYPTVSSVQKEYAVRALGKTESGEWFYVQVPNTEASGCWISAFGFDSSTINVPVITDIPPFQPTRAPTIFVDTRLRVSYKGYGLCNGGVAPIFTVVNKANLPIQTLTIQNTDHSLDPAWTVEFRESKFNLASGKTGSVLTCAKKSHFPHNIEGHQMSAYFTACLTDGTCIPASLSFTP